jgi:hypothetical protein
MILFGVKLDNMPNLLRAKSRDVNGSNTDGYDIIFIFIFLFEYGVGYG